MEQKFWLISVNMGYGHQRTAYSLRDLAYEGRVINVNDYMGIPKRDRAVWEGTRRLYEFISRFQRTPLIGNFVFSVFDALQKIRVFYPKQDLSKPNFTLKQIYSSIKKGWGRDIIEKLKIKNHCLENESFLETGKLKINLPIISTFFTSAFIAEFFNYPGKIFCVVCDADIARTWAPLNPKESKIKYFASTERAVERLKLYGVNKENIFLTGYPLPKELIGSEKMEILKEDLKYRLLNLDPEKRYIKRYKTLIEENLNRLPAKSNHPLTIMFSVGGAGAQKEMAIKIVKSLREKIKKGEVKIILSAGVREKVKAYFEKDIKNLDLIKYNENSSRCIDLHTKNFDPGVEIIFERKIENYFQKFNQALRETDILWTKPSELSFYSALGIPIIISPPIGSQEEFNMRWLLKSGFGLFQENPRYTEQWLFDWLKQGYLAKAAMEGFIEGEKLGTLKIKEIVLKCSGH